MERAKKAEAQQADGSDTGQDPDSADQCDQKKIAKCLQKLPKNDFNRKMIDFKTLYKNCQRMWEIWTN